MGGITILLRFSTLKLSMNIDFLIVGQGLAGSLLAWNLLKAGCKVLVIDNCHSGSATRVGAGIVNTVTGPRLAPCWRLEQLLADCRKTYRFIGEELGNTYYREKELVRFFKNDEERQLWKQKRSASGTNRYLGAMRPPGWMPEAVLDPFGSFSPGGSGHLDMKSLVEDLRSIFAYQGCLIKEYLHYENIVPVKSGLRWKTWNVGKVIFCEGHEVRNNPWFQWLPFKLAKGEILDLKIQQSTPFRQILNSGKWLLPLGNNSYRAGSTYCWDPIDTNSTEAGKVEIISGLKTFLKLPFEVTAQRAGIRPTVKDYKPVLGMHPKFTNLGIFNGLGSKGAFMAPFFAHQMANYLHAGEPLEEEVNLLRFA